MNERPNVVAVTGSSGYIGSRLLQELENQEELGKVVALDLNPLTSPVHNINAHRIDLTKPFDDIFRDHHVNTVVHLAHILRPGRNRAEILNIHGANLAALRNVLKASQNGRIKHFVYLSSHTVYGAYKDNPIPITETVKPRPMANFQYSHEKGLCEELVQEFAAANPSTMVTVLRSSIVMGPTANNYVTRALFKRILLGVSGYNPPLQFVHEDDMARLLCTLVLNPQSGIFNVAGDRTVTYSELARIARRKLLKLPAAISYPIIQLAWKMGIQKESPAVGLDFIRYPILLSTGKLKNATGFRFRYTSEDTLNAFVATNTGE